MDYGKEKALVVPIYYELFRGTERQFLENAGVFYLYRLGG